MITYSKTEGSVRIRNDLYNVSLNIGCSLPTPFKHDQWSDTSDYGM